MWSRMMLLLAILPSFSATGASSLSEDNQTKSLNETENHYSMDLQNATRSEQEEEENRKNLHTPENLKLSTALTNRHTLFGNLTSKEPPTDLNSLQDSQNRIVQRAMPDSLLHTNSQSREDFSVESNSTEHSMILTETHYRLSKNVQFNELLDNNDFTLTNITSHTNELPSSKNTRFRNISTMSNISEYRAEKGRRYNGNEGQKGKNKTNAYSSGDSDKLFLKEPLGTTTPDTHMNDPPFVRGPNIPTDIHEFPHRENRPQKVIETKFEDSKKFQFLKTRIKWERAKQQWGDIWEYHCYVIGGLFTTVGFYSFINLLRAKIFARLSFGYFLSINLFILFMSSSRTFYLLYDPYNLNRESSTVLSHLAFDFLYPCMISSHAVVFLFLLQSTDTRLHPISFQKTYLLTPLIAFYFSLTLACNIIVGFFNAPTKLFLTCQILFLVFTALLCLCYIFVFRRLHCSAVRKQAEIIRITFTKMHIAGSELPKKFPKSNLSHAVKATLAISMLQLLHCCLLLYGIISSLNSTFATKNREFWVWWCFQLICRILELAYITGLLFTTTQLLNNFDVDRNKFCDFQTWCHNLSKCWKKPEVVDFEEHSNNYANLQGLRNYDIRASPRRFNTNSLPTFRTPLNDVDNTIPMRHFGHCGKAKSSNHPSALSLLSYYRSKRNLSSSTNERINFDRSVTNDTLLASVFEAKEHNFRQPSMLYKDNGFIRFRKDNDPEQPMEMSDEDDRILEYHFPDSGDVDSTKADMGSSFCSLLEDDIVPNKSPPLHHAEHSSRFRKLSHVSVATTDYSVDLSSEQLSNSYGFRSGFTSSGLDFNAFRHHGSTCSSESAANSFDVTFFLNGSLSPTIPSQSEATIPASPGDCSESSRSETEEDKTSSVEGHEGLLKSISPIIKRAATKRMQYLPLNLNLSKESNYQNGCINMACGTEDITPDSAVFLDLQFSGGPVPKNKECSKQLPASMSDIVTPLSQSEVLPSNNSFMICNTHIPEDEKQPPPTATSQSLVDLRTSNSYVIVSGTKRSSSSFLNKLRGSAFSLNGSNNGYEPLELTESCNYLTGQTRKSCRKLRRVLSDRRPFSGYKQVITKKFESREFRNTKISSMVHLRDSGLLDDCHDNSTSLVDVASQTE